MEPENEDEWVMVYDTKAFRLEYDVMDSAHCPWCLCDASGWMRPFMSMWYATFPMEWSQEETDRWITQRTHIDPPVLPRCTDDAARRAVFDFQSRAPAQWARMTESFDIGPADAVRHRAAFDRHISPDMWQRHRVQHVRLIPVYR